MARKLADGDQLGWALAVSLAAHVVLIAAVILWPQGHDKRQFFAPTYQVSLVNAPPSAAPAAPKPAPPVAKPAPVKPVPPKPVATAAPPKPKPKDQEAIGTKETAKKRITKKTKPKAPDPDAVLAKRLSQMQAKAKRDQQLEAALQRVESKAETAAAGAGGAYARPGGSEMSARFQLYYTELWERIRRAWNLPEALAGDTKGRMVVVMLRIGRDGSLQKFWLEESSGNQRLDQSALRAVEKAAPFPPLPAGYPGASHEVGIRFRPEEAGG